MKKKMIFTMVFVMISLSACTNQSADDMRQTTVNTQVEATGKDTTVAEKKENAEEQDTTGEANFETADSSYNAIHYISDEHFLEDTSFTANWDSTLGDVISSYTVTAVEAWTGDELSDGGDYFAALTDRFEEERQFYLRDDEYSDDELEYLFYTLKIKNNGDKKTLLNTTAIDVYSRKEDSDNSYPEYGNKYIESVGGDTFALDQSAYSEGSDSYYSISLDAGEEKTVTFAVLLPKEEVGDGELYMTNYENESRIQHQNGNGIYSPTNDVRVKFYRIPWRSSTSKEGDNQ
jgi:hypothetical protein